jgi:menaquinone reductase, multiheme cytochrome c subunit
MEKEQEKEGKAKGKWIFFWVGVAASLVLGWVIFPGLIHSRKVQPVPFSHKTHSEGAGLKCEDCHAFRNDGSFAGIPALAKCLECHESAQGDKKEEAAFIKLAEQLKKENKNVPWLIYSQQPDNVFFSHAAHTKMAKMDCKECHKLVGGTTDKNPVYTYKWISGYAPEVMMMETCEACHEKKGKSNACFVCHK